MAALRQIEEQLGLTAILQGEDRTKDAKLAEVEHVNEAVHQRV
jgi:hypothetical protein